ncbi:succinyldiaminopimelate transaminase [Calidifontibacter sp. DB0510]|uniref:Aminotransferase n=1 Tax=Metallococcus carri TaxID=1656884 RepID=A0A967B0N2_9MICO|nr:succinyldiaminopimelate transaminase [Metallococcus carri]NHN55075.1 succinyldiaminopimelate transaminase [Metallococcus carri]NOP36152.1 succinyldiaminopimelate transaminase [Calidifontibacter sp. DB2511S]
MASLPDFPWDTIAAAKARAAEHPDGIVDLSVGTPVDPTPQVLQDALAGAADAHGYPTVWGTPELRETVAAWYARRRGATRVNPDGVMPTVGSKELVAWLPTLLGLGAGDVVGFPSIAYPTYDVGARLAGATPAPARSLLEYGPSAPKLLWLNTPANPHGQVLPVDHLKKVVDWARQRGVVVASDECYAELNWQGDDPTPGILDDRVSGGDHTGLLSVYSLSKQSSAAGYRAAFVAGDPAIVKRLVDIRKHAGMMAPWPVQQALIAGLSDDTHVAETKKRYRARRATLRPALEAAGWRIDHSEAGLYLWATQGEPCRTSVAKLADLGILAAPGDFYGAAGAQHVRIALTATDERIAAAASRLAGR